MADRMNIKFTIKAIDRFTATMTKLERKLDSLKSKAGELDTTRDMQINADTSTALAEIVRLNNKIDKLDRAAKKPRKIKMKADDANRELQRMSNFITGMSPTKIDVDADTRGAMTGLRDVDGFMSNMRSKNREIKMGVDMDTDGAMRSLQRITNTVSGMDKRLTLDTDTSKAMKSLRDVDDFMVGVQRRNRKIRTDFEIEIGGATRSLQRIARQTDEAQNRASRGLRMNIDTMQATNALRGLQRIIDRTAVPREIDFDVDIDEAVARLGTISSLAGAISRIDPTIDVEADTASATARLTLLQRLKAKLGRPVIVDILIKDYMLFRRNMDRIATTGRNVGEILGNMFMGVATTLSTTVIPIIASTVGAIGALGVMIGTTGGATMGLLSAFVGATGAIGAFAAVAVPAISNFSAKMEEISGLEEEMKLAKLAGDSEKYAEASGKLTAMLDGLSEAQRTTREQMQGLSENFDEISKSMEPGVLQAYGNGMEYVSSILTLGRPLIESSVDAVNNLMDSMNRNIESEDMQAFFEYLNTSGANSLETIGKALGNFLMGFFNLMTAFGPLGQDMEEGFLKMSEGFREWTAALGENKKFQAFVDYVRENWPAVRNIIGTAIAAIIETFAGFSSYATDWMATTQELINKWREFAQGMGENEKFQAFIDYLKTNGPLVTAMIGDMIEFLVALGVALSPVGAKMVEVASAIFNFMSEVLEANPLLGELFGWFVTIAGGIFTLLPLIVGLGSFFSTLVAIGAGVIGFVKTLFSKFGSLTGAVTRIKSAFETFRIVMMFVSGAITPLIAAIVLAVGLVIAVIVRMWKENERFREIVTAAWEAVKLAVSTAVEWISTTVMAIFGALVAWWETHQDKILEIAQRVWDYVYTAIETAIMWILETIVDVVGRIQAFWEEHGDTIVALAKFAWDTLVAMIKRFMGIISGAIEIGMAVITGIFEIVWPFISGLVEVAWKTITAIVETAIDVVGGIINTVMDIISGDWGAAWDSIMGIATDIWEGIVGVFEDIDLAGIGADVIQGLIDGIGSMATAVWDKAKEVAGGVTSAVKGIFQTKSPSRVFHQIGEWTMMGLSNGIEKQAPNSVKAVTRVAEAMTKAFNPNLDASVSTSGGYNAYTTASAGFTQARNKAQESRTVVEVPVYLNGREIAKASNDEQKRMTARENARVAQFSRTGGTQ